MFFETGSFHYSPGLSWSHYAVQTELEFTILNAGDCDMFLFFTFLTRSVGWPRLTVSCLGFLIARIIDPYHSTWFEGKALL